MRSGHKLKNRAAWVVQWNLHREDMPIGDLRPHILPYRWAARKVMDYMRCLYWNSPLCPPVATLAQVSKRKPEGIFIVYEGPRLTYGDATHLVAWRVTDLTIQRTGGASCVLRWTACPGRSYDRTEGKIVDVGKPVTKEFIFTFEVQG